VVIGTVEAAMKLNNEMSPACRHWACKVNRCIRPHRTCKDFSTLRQQIFRRKGRARVLP